jgi:beta-glucanase (GH16 family)
VGVARDRRARMAMRGRVAVGASVLALFAVLLNPDDQADGMSATSGTATAVVPGTSWRDDFNSLNSATWNVIPWGCFDPANVSVANGMLQMRIAPSPRTDCPGVTGARINTYGLKEFRSGTFSARIRFVLAPGSWQTFWMTGAGGAEYPANGEVDIAEVIGRTPQNTHVALHSAFKSGGTKRCDVGGAPPATVDRVWHVYSVTTGPNRVTFKIDGATIASYTPGATCTWPFGDPMRILFSSRGGQYGGEVDPTMYPITYRVDWVSWQAL